MALVVSPGIGAAVRLYMDQKGLTVSAFAKAIGQPASSTHGLLKKNSGAPEAVFDRILAMLPEPWRRPYCKLDERPAVGWPKSKKMKKRYESDTNSFQKLKTPNLDSFNGMEGGWL